MTHFVACMVLPLAASLALRAPAGVAAATSAVPAARQEPYRPSADTTSRRGQLDSVLAAATFDSAWRTVGTSLENRGVRRDDWPAVRLELRPAAARATTDSALRAVIDTMLRRLGESHFAVLPGGERAAAAEAGAPPRAAALGTVSIDPRIVDGHLVVWRADTAGAARRAGLAPGWTLERIEDFIVPSAIPRSRDSDAGGRRVAVLTGALRALHGVPGSTVQIVARDERGERHTLSVARDSVHGPTFQFGNLPPLPAGLVLTRRTTADGRCIGVIAFEYWLPPVMPAMDRAVDAVRGCAGIVLDLRGNLGGVAGMVMGVAGHFMTEPRALGTMRSRGEEMRFVANPRRATDAGAAVQPFGGPLALLVDELSASTSEMFVVGLQSLGRARVFGERSAGQALPAMATRLPNGDVLMYVVADFVAPDGSRIEGRGVIPDEHVPLDRNDLRAGRDASLEAAVRWIERARLASLPQ